MIKAKVLPTEEERLKQAAQIGKSIEAAAQQFESDEARMLFYTLLCGLLAGFAERYYPHILALSIDLANAMMRDLSANKSSGA